MKLAQNNKKNCTFGMLKIVRVVKIDFSLQPSQVIVMVFLCKTVVNHVPKTVLHVV